MDTILIKKTNYQVNEEIKPYLFVVSDNDKKYFAYDFSNDLESFSNFKFAFKRLTNSGVTCPKVLVVDKKNHRFLVEYVSGKTAFELLVEKDLDEKIIEQVFLLNYKARMNGMALDFDPDNFIVMENKLYYMPFTFDQYRRDEDFTQNKVRLWFYTKEFKDLLIKRGIQIDKSRLMNEFERNKQIVLTVVKYFR